MKITIYDLLGLVKEDKAPQKIKCYDEIFKLNEVASVMPDLYTMDNLYVDSEGYRLFCEYNWQLNDEVQIIEKEKAIEKLSLKGGYTNNQKKIVKKINELIKSVNEIKKVIK